MAIAGLWGNKIGMTQVFVGDKAVIVTAIDTSGWYVVGFKTQVRDGYKAVVLGNINKRYQDQKFDAAWLKKLSKYFSHVREVRCGELPAELVIGAVVTDLANLNAGTSIDAIGISIGRGFAGVVKRWNFGGSRASHGAKNMLRRPGALSFMRSEGRVIKGKKMPGHMGVERCTVKNLRVVKFDTSANLMLVSGAVPGKTGSLVFVRKCE
jgi:large subunit ribosomal protein L3